MSSTSGMPRATTPRSIQRVHKALTVSEILERPGPPGRFFVGGRVVFAAPGPGRVPPRHEIFSPDQWNQSRLKVLTHLGWGSIPLILLHHLLFQLDPGTDRQFNNAKSHSSLQICARTFL